MSTKKNMFGREYTRGEALSDDFRSLVVKKILDSGGSALHVPRGTYCNVSKLFGVHHSAVKKVWLKYLEDGCASRRKTTRIYEKKLLPTEVEFIQVLKHQKPSMYIREVTKHLNSHKITPGKVSESTVGRTVRNDMNDGKYSFKKISRPEGQRFTLQNLRYTQAYLDYIFAQDPYKVKYFDESGFKISVANRNFGHSKVGEKCIEIGRYHASPNITLNLLVGLGGVMYYNFVDGPSNSAHYMSFFHEAIESVLADGQPCLAPGDIIVVDNCPFHHHNSEIILTNWLNRQGIQYIFLPAYSPDMNPVESCFSKLKSVLKRQEYIEAVSVNLKLSITHALKEITIGDINGYYRHSETLNI